VLAAGVAALEEFLDDDLIQFGDPAVQAADRLLERPLLQGRADELVGRVVVGVAVHEPVAEACGFEVVAAGEVVHRVRELVLLAFGEDDRPVGADGGRFPQPRDGGRGHRHTIQNTKTVKARPATTAMMVTVI
jgi:hypothetical protein